MSDSNDDHRRQRPELTSVDAAFEPEPVAPDDAKRRDSVTQAQAPRSIVELTSPIGHRLRVPPPLPEPGERPAGKPPDEKG